MAISAFLSLEGGEAASDEEAFRLLQRGWAPADSAPCENLASGYFEVESENESFEIYVGESVITGRPSPWPEPPYRCRPIPKPSFVREIL